MILSGGLLAGELACGVSEASSHGSRVGLGGSSSESGWFATHHEATMVAAPQL